MILLIIGFCFPHFETMRFWKLRKVRQGFCRAIQKGSALLVLLHNVSFYAAVFSSASWTATIWVLFGWKAFYWMWQLTKLFLLWNKHSSLLEGDENNLTNSWQLRFNLLCTFFGTSPRAYLRSSRLVSNHNHNKSLSQSRLALTVNLRESRVKILASKNTKQWNVQKKSLKLVRTKLFGSGKLLWLVINNIFRRKENLDEWFLVSFLSLRGSSGCSRILGVLLSNKRACRDSSWKIKISFAVRVTGK